MITALKRTGITLGVVVIENGNTKVFSAFEYQGKLVRPDGWKPLSRPEWLRKLRSLVGELKHEPSKFR